MQEEEFCPHPPAPAYPRKRRENNGIYHREKEEMGRRSKGERQEIIVPMVGGKGGESGKKGWLKTGRAACTYCSSKVCGIPSPRPHMSLRPPLETNSM